jgi:hypothetical protein
MPTPDVFNFDTSDLATYDPEKIDEILGQQPALYLNHLHIARSLNSWATRLESGEYSDRPFGEDPFQQGYARALQEVAAHLRQADYVEGGSMLDTDARRPQR